MPKRKQLGRDAARKVAVAGDQRRRRCRARRLRAAQRDGDRQRLVALVGGSMSGHLGKRGM